MVRMPIGVHWILVPHGEYDWTICLSWRCGLASNYSDHLLLYFCYCKGNTCTLMRKPQEQTWTPDFACALFSCLAFFRSKYTWRTHRWLVTPCTRAVQMSTFRQVVGSTAFYTTNSMQFQHGKPSIYDNLLCAFWACTDTATFLKKTDLCSA